MEPVSTPTSPLSPTFPASSLPSNLPASKNTHPRLRINTNLPFSTPHISGLDRLQYMQTPGRNAAFAQIQPSKNRRLSSASTIVLSPSMDAILNQPLTALPTPLSAHPSSFANRPSLFSPMVGKDGRQSRLAMRSPASANTTLIPNPAVALPLRLGGGQSNMTPDLMSPNRSPNLVTAANTTSSHLRARHGFAGICPSPPLDPLLHRSLSSSSTASSKRCRSTPSSPLPSPAHKRQRSLDPASTPKHQASILSSPTGFHPFYLSALAHLATPLVPLVSITTGLSHPAFPRSLLQYHLLTHTQLDALARHYHQIHPPNLHTFGYPGLIPPYCSAAPSSGVGQQSVSDGRSKTNHNLRSEETDRFHDVTLATKRRRWGRFIGLRGCETPTDPNETEESTDEMIERMEKEWRRAKERAVEERQAWEKGWMRRW